MDAPSLVIIARSEHLPAIRKRLGEAGTAYYTDGDSLQALQAIVRRPPKIVAVDLVFAATARGAALVARLKSEPELSSIEVRVLIEDETKAPLLLDHPVTSPDKTVLQTSRPLDRAGTRRAVRFPMNRRDVIVNGEHAHLVDLSTTGAQVLVSTRLRPDQPLRLVLADESTEARCHGKVAWSIVVPAGATMQYRAGIEFLEPDARVLQAFCERHGGRPDLTFSAGT